jgi:hypothetical protein
MPCVGALSYQRNSTLLEDSAPNVNLGRGIAHLFREQTFDAAGFNAGVLGHHLSCQLP